MKEIYLLSLTYMSGKKGQRDTTRWYNSVYLAYCSVHNMSNQPMYARTCTVSLLTSMRTCFYCIFAGIDKSAYFGLKEEKKPSLSYCCVTLNDSLVNE